MSRTLPLTDCTVVLNDAGVMLAYARSRTALNAEVRRFGYASLTAMVADGCTVHETTVAITIEESPAANAMEFTALTDELTIALADDDYEAAESAMRRINDANLDRAALGLTDGIHHALGARRMIREHAEARRAKTLGTVPR